MPARAEALLIGLAARATSMTQSGRPDRIASLALLLGTFFWGFGFTWAKEGGEAANEAAGLNEGSPAGPIILLILRFLVSSVLWLIVFPQSRRGWSAASVWRSFAIGIPLGIGLIMQHIGLDRSSPAVTAFLTSLTIVFVPLLMTVVLRKPPVSSLWVGVVLATAGVWMLTGAAPTGFGLGELLGLGCAIVFSAYILTVNVLNPRDSAWRMAAGQFIVATIVMIIGLLFVPSGARTLAPAEFIRITTAPDVLMNAALLTGLTTFGAYGLLNIFQPRVDPTRAALIYLVEPILAAMYSWYFFGERLTVLAILGAALILLANGFVELWETRGREARLRDQTANPPAPEIPI